MVGLDYLGDLKNQLTVRTDVRDRDSVPEQLELSVVIPAKNEMQRLPGYLFSIRDYLSNQYDLNYEIIVVDDGSSDGLFDELVELKSVWQQLVPLQHPVNLGKGAAVKTGVLASKGRRVLFADADGATPIYEEQKLSRLIKSGSNIAIGSRTPDEADANCTRVRSRHLMGNIFTKLTQFFCSLSYSDTQCGFKMFSRESALRLFNLCDEPGYLFDIQILMLADFFKLSVSPVSVEWSEIEGSKVRIIHDSFKMFCGIVKMKKRLKKITEKVGQPL